MSVRAFLSVATTLTFALTFSCAGRAPPQNTPRVRPGVSPAPACAVTTYEDQDSHVYFSLEGRTSKNALPDWAVLADALRLSVYPLDASSVLAAFTTDLMHMTPPVLRAGVLWRVSCENVEFESYFQQEGADFGKGIVSANGNYIYFADKRGVSALHIRNKTVRSVTQVRDEYWPSCSGLYGGSDTKELHHVPAGLLRNGRDLSVHIGTHCGLHGDWQAEHYVARDVVGHTPGQKLYRASPVSTVVADSHGVLWVGTGGQCRFPGLYEHFDGKGIWRSGDAGNTWQRVRWFQDNSYEHASPGVAAIWINPSNSDHILVHAEGCYMLDPESEYDVDSLDLARLRLSLDGGQHWRSLGSDIARSDGWPWPEAVQVSPNLKRIVAFYEPTEPGTTECKVSQDGGRTWHVDKKAVESIQRSLPSKTTVAHGYRFTATEDGLVREPFDGKGKQEVVFRFSDQETPVD